jgi:hypothetical protein
LQDTDPSDTDHQATHPALYPFTLALASSRPKPPTTRALVACGFVIGHERLSCGAKLGGGWLLALTDIDETTKDPSKLIETKIGPHLMKIIDKFPDLKEQWDEMSLAYYETVRTHEQWCALLSTPPSLPNQAIGLTSAWTESRPLDSYSKQ